MSNTTNATNNADTRPWWVGLALDVEAGLRPGSSLFWIAALASWAGFLFRYLPGLVHDHGAGDKPKPPAVGLANLMVQIGADIVAVAGAVFLLAAAVVWLASRVAYRRWQKLPDELRNVYTRERGVKIEKALVRLQGPVLAREDLDELSLRHRALVERLLAHRESADQQLGCATVTDGLRAVAAAGRMHRRLSHELIRTPHPQPATDPRVRLLEDLDHELARMAAQLDDALTSNGCICDSHDVHESGNKLLKLIRECDKATEGGRRR